MTRTAGYTLLACLFVATGFAACSLNPQPLPPSGSRFGDTADAAQKAEDSSTTGLFGEAGPDGEVQSPGEAGADAAPGFDAADATPLDATPDADASAADATPD